MLTLRDLPKGKIAESARHILKVANNKNHTPCKECQPFIEYTKRSMLRDINFTTISV